jgi:two-component system LytT family response regulator
MIRCIAVDDEPLALRQIKSYIERIPSLELVATCRNAAEAEAVLDGQQVDLVFVDINMPGRNGLDLVRGLKMPPMIIFTTAYSEFAVEGFRLDAVDYLLKPFSFAEFNRAAEKALSLHNLMQLQRQHDTATDAKSSTPVAEMEPDIAPTSDSISIKADYKVSIVRYADIIYIESVGEYIRLHLANAAPITTLFRLKNMESALPSDTFMRVHRSYIVNLNYVKSYGRGRIYLANDEYVPLSINYKESFREYIESKRPL